ncbi:MAG: hypothetical protein N2234_00385 [Planctomycetota bacterium]|nr:hypothetical protein [Planctomycetota bacterium]
MEPLREIIHRVIAKDTKERKRLSRVQATIDECLKDNGIKAEVTAVRKGTIFLKVGTQAEKSEIESFFREKIVRFVNTKLGTSKFEKLKVRVEKR